MSRCERNYRERKESGFTLIEVLISFLVAVLVLVGVIEALFYLTALTTSNRSRSLVFGDVQMTMERISGISFGDLSGQFPDAQPLSTGFVTNVLGGYKAPNEVVTVSYPNGAASNPREILVTGQWTEKGAVRTVTLPTFRRG